MQIKVCMVKIIQRLNPGQSRFRKSWDRREWSGVRNAADQELVICKVRDKTLEDQFTRMTEDQQEEMNKFKRPLLDRSMEMSYSDDGDNEKISKIGKTYGEKNQELV